MTWAAVSGDSTRADGTTVSRLRRCHHLIVIQLLPLHLLLLGFCLLALLLQLRWFVVVVRAVSRLQPAQVLLLLVLLLVQLLLQAMTAVRPRKGRTTGSASGSKRWDWRAPTPVLSSL